MKRIKMSIHHGHIATGTASGPILRFVPLQPPSKRQGEAVAKFNIIPQDFDCEETTEHEGSRGQSFQSAVWLPPSTTCAELLSSSPPRKNFQRRGASAPTQLLKYAFEASMSMYDLISDDDEADEDEDNNYALSSTREG